MQFNLLSAACMNTALTQFHEYLGTDEAIADALKETIDLKYEYIVLIRLLEAYGEALLSKYHELISDVLKANGIDITDEERLLDYLKQKSEHQ